MISNTDLIKCPICSERAKFAYPGQIWQSKENDTERTYGQCNNCEVLFSHPIPTTNEINTTYLHYPANKYFKENRFLKWLQAYHRFRRLKSIFKELDDDLRSGTLLDVGCSYGWFLKESKKQGIDAYGIDIVGSQLVTDYPLNDISIINGKFEDYQNFNSRFNFITMWHTLEHMVNPAKSLRAVAQNLEVGGYGIITVPNYHSKALSKRSWRWDWLGNPSVHVFCFSINSIRNILPPNLKIVKVTSRDTWNGQYIQLFKPFVMYRNTMNRLFGFLINKLQKIKMPFIPSLLIITKNCLLQFVQITTYIIYITLRPFLKKYEDGLLGSELLLIVKKTTE